MDRAPQWHELLARRPGVAAVGAHRLQALDPAQVDARGDDRGAVVLPHDIHPRAQAGGDGHRAARALGGRQGHAGVDGAAQDGPDAAGDLVEADAVIHVVEAAGGHAADLLEGVEDSLIHLPVQASPEHLGPGGALAVPAVAALDERQEAERAGVAAAYLGAEGDLEGHDALGRAGHAQEAVELGLPVRRAVLLGAERQFAGDDDDGGSVLAVLAHGAGAVARPARGGLRGGGPGAAAGVEHGLVGAPARAAHLGHDDVPAGRGGDGAHAALLGVAPAAHEGLPAHPGDDRLIGDTGRPVILGDLASHGGSLRPVGGQHPQGRGRRRSSAPGMASSEHSDVIPSDPPRDRMMP